jgi:hypothetical protein
MDFENFDLNIINNSDSANRNLFNRHYLAYSKDKNNPQEYEIIESDHSADQIGTLISWGTMLMQLSSECLIFPQIEQFPNQNQRKLVFKHQKGLRLVDYLKDEINPSTFDLLYIFYILAHDLRLMHLKGLVYGGWAQDSIYLSAEEVQFSYVENRNYLVNEPINKPIRVLIPKIKYLKPYAVNQFEYQQVRDARKLAIALYTSFVLDKPEMPAMTENERKGCRDSWHAFKKSADQKKINPKILNYLRECAENPKTMDQLYHELHDLLQSSFSEHFIELDKAFEKRFEFRRIFDQYNKLKRTLTILTSYVDRWLSMHHERMSLCDEQIHQLYEVLKETDVLKKKIEFLSRQEIYSNGFSLDQIKKIDELVYKSSHVAHRINSRPPMPQTLEDFPGTFLREMNTDWSMKVETEQDHLFDELKIFHPNWQTFESKLKKSDPSFSLNGLSVVLTQTPIPQAPTSTPYLNAFQTARPSSKPSPAYSSKPISKAPVSFDEISNQPPVKRPSISMPAPKAEYENEDRNQPSDTVFHPTVFVSEMIVPGQTKYFETVSPSNQIYSNYHTNPEEILKTNPIFTKRSMILVVVLLLTYFFWSDIKEKGSIILDYYVDILENKIDKKNKKTD